MKRCTLLVYTNCMTADELKRYRKKLRMTQAELARELGVTVTTVARWEQGARDISGPVSLAVRLLVKSKTGGN